MKILTVLLTGSLLLSGAVFAADKKVPEKKVEKKEEKIEKQDKTIWTIAQGSKDHSTLVAAIEAVQKDADAGNKRFALVTALTQAGPYTVFAPVNGAFDKLPKGTVEALLKDTEKLENILLYHVYVGSLDTRRLTMMAKGEMELDQANVGDEPAHSKVKLGEKDGKITVNGNPIVASIYGNNGWIHVIDTVLLPPAAKPKTEAKPM